MSKNNCYADLEVQRIFYRLSNRIFSLELQVTNKTYYNSKIFSESYSEMGYKEIFVKKMKEKSFADYED